MQKAGKTRHGGQDVAGFRTMGAGTGPQCQQDTR